MKHVFLIVGLFFAMATSVFAQKSSIFKTSEGAIKGYDPVAFFKNGSAMKGDKSFSYSWNDATWYFSSQQNLDAFKMSPEKYAPQYGGYCAYGAAAGHKAPTEPENTWTILGGKLYFNYNKDVKAMWSKDEPGYIIKADKNWPMIMDKE